MDNWFDFDAIEEQEDAATEDAAGTHAALAHAGEGSPPGDGCDASGPKEAACDILADAGGGEDGEDWADPAVFAERAIAELEEELRKIAGRSASERRASFRQLQLRWHPDKNPDNVELATVVFQWLQQQTVLGHGGPGQDGAEEQRAAALRSLKPSAEALKASRQVAPLGSLSMSMKICARNGAFEFVELLTRRGHAVNHRDDRGRTALFYAARGVRDTSGRLTVNLSGSVSLSEGDVQFTGSKKGKSPPVDFVDRMVYQYLADVNAVGTMKDTPLMEAARFGNAAATARLLELRADASCEDAYGNTALDMASAALPEFLTKMEAGCPSEIDNAWDVWTTVITRDRAKVAVLLQARMRLGIQEASSAISNIHNAH